MSNHRGRTTYAEKLKDPRWQKRRLQILERDGWKCQSCESTTQTLHVHHKWYEGEPWEAPDEALGALCELCHRQEWEYRPDVEGQLLMALRRHLHWHEVDVLADLFAGMPTGVCKSLANGFCDWGDSKSTNSWLRARRDEVLAWLQGWEERNRADRP